MVPLSCTVLHAQETDAHRQEIVSHHSAASFYETGFAHGVRFDAPSGSVALDNMVLIDNDGPGAGYSQKGEFRESIHQGVMARKILRLDDANAMRAHCVLFMTPKAPNRHDQRPFEIAINGRAIPSPPLSWHEPQWHWVEFPPQWLVVGENEIIVSCSAPEGEGYDLLIAREDEYEGGGGAATWRGGTGYVALGSLPFDHENDELDPIEVGESSFRSTNGGGTWSTGLGPLSDITGEYTIRLNLQRFQSTGELRSNAIDLWEGREQWDIISPQTRVETLRVHGTGSVPDGTGLSWRIRFADTADMNDESWKDFRAIGGGADLDWSTEQVTSRYAQLAVRFSTSDSLSTPRFHDLKVERTLAWEESALSDFTVIDAKNTSHVYSSFPQEHEDSRHPRLEEIREALGIDDVVGDARGDFERINLLRHHVSSLWKHQLPDPEYPPWDAIGILDRRDRSGAGGFCMQFSIVFMQALQAEGYLARHINVFAHETVEVYVNELDRWVIVDPESVFDSYAYDERTGLPLGALEQHEAFLDAFGLSERNPIRWQALEPWGWPQPEVHPQAISFSTMTPSLANPDRPPPQYRLAGFVRMLTRSDFLSRPTPVPVNNGLIVPWPWTGYINWFDEATPRKLQYGIHTDRVVDFYPTLHRVQFTALLDQVLGTLDIGMFTNTPNFDTFEVRLDDTEWMSTDAQFTWQLRPGALNGIEMRSRNLSGRVGPPSRLALLWHNRPPYSEVSE